MTVAGTGTRTLLLCGYYGENNLGDCLLYTSDAADE